MNKITKYSAIASAFLPVLVSAQVTTTGQLFDKIETLLGWFVGIFFLIATVFIIIAAYKYLTAKGDPDAVKEAQNRLIYAVIAIVVAILAYSIPRIVESFLGVSAITTLP